MQVSRSNKELRNASLPPQELVECVASCRNQFETLRTRVLKLAESFAVPTPTPEEISSFKALESLLQDVTEAQKKATRRRQSLKVVNRVLAADQDHIDFLPLLNPDVLRYLIWQLISEDRLGIAFRLARYLEIHSPDLHPRLPSWLLRAVFVGRHMRYDISGGGGIAKIFADANVSCFVNGEGEWNQAVSLLLAASALRPALLAPNTGVLEILQSLQLGESLSQLNEYCQTIATYGSQLQSLDASAFKKTKEQAARQQASDDLRHQSDCWIKLQGYYPNYGNYYQQQTEQLKQVVSSRQNAVLEELNSFEQRNSSVLVLAGVHCCRTIVKDLQGAFRSRRVSNGLRTSQNY